MVIYTPRLCNDVAFLPARENRANGISCTEILSPSQVEEYNRLKSEKQLRDTQRLLSQEAQEVFSDALEKLGKKPTEAVKGSERQKKSDDGGEHGGNDEEGGVDDDEALFLLDL